MRKLTFILLIIPFYLASASELDITLSEVTDNLSEPWGMSFIDDEKLLITEKTGAIIRIDMKTGTKYEIEHDLNFYYYGQGGLLDILYHDGYVYVSYSEDRENGYSSTSVARGVYDLSLIHI